jgi:hypothetical protein
MPVGQLAAVSAVAQDGNMFRLLKYLPVIIPVVSKFVKSPRGQRMIQSAKSRIGRRGNGTASNAR